MDLLQDEGSVMGTDDVVQIRVGGFTVGIVGLRQTMESMAREYAEQLDQVVEKELLARLGKRNYIPDRAREEYGKAFLREFKRLLGKEVVDDRTEGLEIKVLGQGCAQCDRLEQEIMAVMAESGIVANVDHVRDVKEIGKYGVLGMPALIVNGKVKSVGKVPPRASLREWLNEAQRAVRSAERR
jgi:small redox-active disulfide protein 2